MSSPVRNFKNYMVIVSESREHEVICVKNLVIFPGAEATFSNVTLTVKNVVLMTLNVGNKVLTGTLNVVDCKVNITTLFNGCRTLDDLQRIIGLTGLEIRELVQKIGDKMSVAAITKSTIKECWNPGCAKENSIMKRCSRCREAIYCNRTCQKAHWKEHKVTCLTSIDEKKSPEKSMSDICDVSSARFKAGYKIFEQQCIRDGSPFALKEAQKYAAEGKMVEAASFISIMTSNEQDIFLKEMEGKEAWKSVDVAIMLGKSKRMKEALEIMEHICKKYPREEKHRFADDKRKFTQAVCSREEFLARYQNVYYM